MKIYIVTELLSRELIGNLLLAAILAARGHIAIILNQEDAFVLSRGSVSGTTVFHAKSLHCAQERISQHKKLRRDGFVVTSMDQENAMLNPQVADFLSGRFCEESLETVDRVFTWNEIETRELTQNFPEIAGKIIESGSPRVDVWNPRFRGMGRQSRPGRKQILLTPSISLNDSLRHWENMVTAKSVLGNRPLSDEGMEYKLTSLCNELRSQIFFSRLALMLADTFTEHDIVIQPKKSEMREAWLSSLNALDRSGNGTRANLFLEYSRILEESIHGAEVVVNSNSTAGLTALIARVPLISFGPTVSIADQLGASAKSVDEALTLVWDALAEPQNFISAYEARCTELLGDRVMVSDSRLAAEEIADELEALGSAVPSRLGLKDFLLFLYPGSFRRFFGALKSLLLLRRPSRAHPEMIARVSQERVEELLRGIVDGISVEMPMRATVAGGRNIVVTARA